MEATIYEAGNGFPAVGEYLQCDGDLYIITATGSSISTHRAGIGNSIAAEVEPADWDDLEGSEPFNAQLKLN